MKITTIDLPASPERSIEIRRIIVMAGWHQCAIEVWPAPNLGPNGLTLHAWVESPELEAEELETLSSDDPLRTRFDSYRYLFGPQIEEEAAAVPDDHPALDLA